MGIITDLGEIRRGISSDVYHKDGHTLMGTRIQRNKTLIIDLQTHINDKYHTSVYVLKQTQKEPYKVTCTILPIILKDN